MTKPKCPYFKHCLNVKECLEALIFKYWDANKQTCVMKGNIRPTALSKRINPITDDMRLHIIDSSGKELSNQELRAIFGQGRGVRKSNPSKIVTE